MSGITVADRILTNARRANPDIHDLNAAVQAYHVAATGHSLSPRELQDAVAKLSEGDALPTYLSTFLDDMMQ